MGLAVLGPDVNKSRWAYRGKERVIRMGLQQLKGVRREALEKSWTSGKGTDSFVPWRISFVGRTWILP